MTHTDSPLARQAGEGGGEGPFPQRPQPFPWREAMALGFGVLRLSSHDFWALTPRELAAAIEGLTGRMPQPMDRAAFEDLARRYPD